jgi:hypothetical protein
VHDEVSDHLMIWFYFWEPELRLRLRWSDPGKPSAHARGSRSSSTAPELTGGLKTGTAVEPEEYGGVKVAPS